MSPIHLCNTPKHSSNTHQRRPRLFPRQLSSTLFQGTPIRAGWSPISAFHLSVCPITDMALSRFFWMLPWGPCFGGQASEKTHAGSSGPHIQQMLSDTRINLIASRCMHDENWCTWRLSCSISALSPRPL